MSSTNQRFSKRQKKVPSKLSNSSPTSALSITKPPPPPNAIDASIFNGEAIQYMRGVDPTWAARLDFVNCSDEMITQLFVVGKSLQKNSSTSLLPPRALRRSSTSMMEFFRMGPNQQRTMIDRYSIFDGDFTPQPHTNKCMGITLMYIKQFTFRSTDTKEKTEMGFIYLLRESKQVAYELQNPDNMQWPPEYCLPIVGCLVLDSGAGEVINWVVEELPGFPFDRHGYRHTLVRHVNCTKLTSNNNILCDNCSLARPSFFRKCVEKYELKQSTPVHKNTRHLVLRRNPSLMLEKLDMVTANLHKLQKKYYKKIAARLMNATSCNFPINEHTNDLFDEQHMTHYTEFINSTEVTNSTLAKYIIAESFRKHKIARESGVTAVRHCMQRSQIQLLQNTS